MRNPGIEKEVMIKSASGSIAVIVLDTTWNPCDFYRPGVGGSFTAKDELPLRVGHQGGPFHRRHTEEHRTEAIYRSAENSVLFGKAIKLMAEKQDTCLASHDENHGIGNHKSS